MAWQQESFCFFGQSTLKTIDDNWMARTCWFSAAMGKPFTLQNLKNIMQNVAKSPTN